MQVDISSKLDSIPKNSYMVVKGDHDNEDHIIEKRPSTSVRVAADKLVNDVFSYAPKGMKGSKNSNFYEFLSLGLIPNLVGSATLILLSNAMNSRYGGRNTMFANMNGKKMAAGVVLYAAGKTIGNKIINKGVKAKTDIDVEMPYKKVVNTLPEYKGDTNTTSVEFHKVFESVDFPRWDLINKQGEYKGNRYEYYDKIAEKMGYNQPLNAPDQVVQPKIKEVLVKTNAAKAVSSYIWAALGVAIASQDAFGNYMSYRNKPSIGKFIVDLPKRTVKTLAEATKSLWKTPMGKGLFVAAAASSVIGIFNATRNFKAEKEKKKSTVDYNNSYMEF